MDGAGDELLTGAGLAKEQDGGIAWGDRFDELEDVLDSGAVADYLIELQFGADLFFEVEFLLREFVFELRNLPVRQHVLHRKCYLTGDPSQEIELILAVRIMLGSHQAQRAHNSIVARKWQHASSAESLRKQKLPWKSRACLLASAGPGLTRLEHVACNRAGERNRSPFFEASRLRAGVERIDLQLASIRSFQKNANSVGVYGATDAHHHCSDKVAKLLVRDSLSGQFQE